MNPHLINTGGIFSGIDYRDKFASMEILTAGTPSILPATHRTDLGSVLMQSHIPACVSHSVVYCIRLYWFIKTGKWIDFSPRFLDILSDEPDIPIDGGRRPRVVFKVAMNVGCCTTATLPNDVSLSIEDYRNKAVITQAMRDEAAQYKIPGFIQIELDLNNYRKGIYFFGAVSTLFAVGKEMYDPSWNPVDTDPLRTPAVIQSGHQMTGDGWNTDVLNTLQNEWSDAWGVKGRTEWNHKDWSPYIYEAWAVAEVPADLTNFLKNLPSPANFHYVWNNDMHLGNHNDDVKFAQIALMILGLLKPIAASDLGYYGPKTAAAVMSYQSQHGIYPLAPNSIGPRTRAALNKQFIN